MGLKKNKTKKTPFYFKGSLCFIESSFWHWKSK